MDQQQPTKKIFSFGVVFIIVILAIVAAFIKYSLTKETDEVINSTTDTPSGTTTSMVIEAPSTSS